MTDQLTNPLDGPPVDPRFERAFRLPEYVRGDSELVQLYEDMVSDLRREAAGLPLNTLQIFLIERIASFYVQIKFKENAESFSPNQQKEFNEYWLKLTHEFNSLLHASDAKLREQLMMDIEKLVTEAINLVTDSNDRQAVRRKLSSGFAELGV